MNNGLFDVNWEYKKPDKSELSLALWKGNRMKRNTPAYASDEITI